MRITWTEVVYAFKVIGGATTGQSWQGFFSLLNRKYREAVLSGQWIYRMTKSRVKLKTTELFRNLRTKITMAVAVEMKTRNLRANAVT